MHILSVLVLTLAAAWSAHGFGSGAPQSACLTMVPQHPVSPQASKAPYKILTNVKEVKQGDRVEIKIVGDNAKNTIGGLLLVGRAGGKAVGRFDVRPDDQFAQPLDCNGPATAVTHKKHNNKAEKSSLSYVWTAPKDFAGDVIFRATVALNGAVFWVGVDSAPVKVSK